MLAAEGDGLRALQPARDVSQGPVKLPQHIHNASEGFSDRRTFTAERVELALERAVRPAKLAQFTAKSLELLFSRFERAAQAIALLDQ